MIARISVACACTLLAASPARADCIDYTHEPAAPPPAALWDHPDAELVPGAIVVDSTAFDGTQLDDGRLPRPGDVDVESGILLLAYRGGFQIRDARGDLATAPALLSSRGLWEGDFPGFTARTAEFRDILWGIDAPRGDPTTFALVGVAPVGFSVWDATDPSQPRPLYVDGGVPWLVDVYAAVVGGTRYAFTAEYDALHVYDLDAARMRTTTCVDDPSHGDDACGVHVGRADGAGKFMDGVQVGDATLVVTSGGSYARPPRGVRVWDVSDPGAPALVASGIDRTTWGIGAWEHDGRAWLAVRTEDEGGVARLEVYEITECASGACAWPEPVASVELVQDVGIPELLRVVSTGEMNGVPFVYTASLWSCVASGTSAVQRQHDSLFDMSDPQAPRDVTPPYRMDQLGRDVDYWSWYYTDQLGGGDLQKGFNHVFPGGAAFAGPRMYRAFGTLLDVHEWTAAPPAPEVDDASDENDSSAGDDGSEADAAADALGGSSGGCACRTTRSTAGYLWFLLAVALPRRHRRR